MNKVILIGRIASDPILKKTSSELSYVNLNLAVNDSFDNKISYFFPCVAWGKRAEFIQSYLKKGDLVSIDGRITRKSYTNQAGQLTYRVDVVIDQISRLSQSSNNQKAVTPQQPIEQITVLPKTEFNNLPKDNEMTELDENDDVSLDELELK